MQLGKIIGIGKTAVVYEWGEDKVLKLFYKGYPKEATEKEFSNAMVINNMNFRKSKAYEIVTYKEQMGIIYDRVDGVSLSDWVSKTGDIQKCAEYMAELHKEIIRNEAHNIPNYKEFLERNIKNAQHVKTEKQKEALHILNQLPDGNTLCHGDFHPGNILLSGEQTTVIDFMNICRGVPLYDVARTVFLVEYTPVPIEADNRDQLQLYKRALADLYLVQMNVSREMIHDYLTVIIAARAGECSD